MLHPAHGNKPVAEGIAGSKPPPKDTEGGICRSLLLELCKDGQQTVKVTKLHRKGIYLMFPEDNAHSAFLDDYVSPPAHSNTYATWSTRYLAYKTDED